MQSSDYTVKKGEQAPSLIATRDGHFFWFSIDPTPNGFERKKEGQLDGSLINFKVLSFVSAVLFFRVCVDRA